MLLEILLIGTAMPVVALGFTARMVHAPKTSTELYAEVDEELIHRLWVALDGPNRHLVSEAQFWREIGGLRGLWRMWLQVRTMVSAIAERAKEREIGQVHAEAEMANDDFHAAVLISLREWFTRSRKVHVKACVRAFLRVAAEFECVQLAG